MNEKYKNEFLKNHDLKYMNADISKILEYEDYINKECINWSIDEVKDFIKSRNCLTPNIANKVLHVLKKFIEFICIRKNISDVKISEYNFGNFDQLIDYSKLKSVTIKPYQYIHIKNQIDMNIRDKVIFELAWNTLSKEEISALKESDIEFIKTELDMEYVLLNTYKRVVRIDDPEVVEDIKHCMREQYHTSETKAGVIKRYKYKDSDYLIKPANVGKNKDSDGRVENLSIAFKMICISQDIKCDGIDIDSLSLEAIRRSKIIFMMQPENEKYFSYDAITAFLDAGDITSMLFWYTKVSKMIYSDK